MCRFGGFFEVSAAAPPRDADDGQIVEVCEPAVAFAGTLGRRLAVSGGAALLIDYGPENSAPGDSLQAVRCRQVQPIRSPRPASLT